MPPATTFTAALVQKDALQKAESRAHKGLKETSPTRCPWECPAVTQLLRDSGTLFPLHFQLCPTDPASLAPRAPDCRCLGICACICVICTQQQQPWARITGCANSLWTPLAARSFVFACCDSQHFCHGGDSPPRASCPLLGGRWAEADPCHPGHWPPAGTSNSGMTSNVLVHAGKYWTAQTAFVQLHVSSATCCKASELALLQM